jgi:hypothetical protein
MPILNPIHLFEQADKLVEAPPAGPPRQVDLRRAISSSYYAVFHLTLTALADEFIGAAHRGTDRYALMHRSVDHRAIKDLCSVVSQSKPPAKYGPYVPANGFGPELLTFASAFIDLQDKRHRADYDVATRYRQLDARLAITTGRSAMTGFTAADAAKRRMFLTLLLCRPR